MTENWLELRNIDIAYESRNIIKNVNLTLSIGDITVIIGPNGSGKSTLIKLIAKLLYPIVKINSHIKIFNRSDIDIWELRSQIGFVLSDIDNRIKNTMSVQDVVLSGYYGTFGLVKNNLISRQKLDYAENILAKLNLTQLLRQYYCNLSDGQKRRILIARSLINNPKVLVLDEPSSLLDVRSNYELLDILSDLTSEGLTLLYVTNSIENIIKETNRVLFIKGGKIINDGPPKIVLNSKNISELYEYSMKITNIDGFWRTVPNN